MDSVAQDIYENRSIEVPFTYSRAAAPFPFAQDFEEAASHRIRLDAPGRCPPLGRLSPDGKRWCRICLRRAPDVTFRKDAHVVPQGYGNRELKTLEECDECNQQIGDQIEQDFLNYTAPWRAMSPHRTRRGGYKLRVQGRESYIQNGEGSGTGRPTLFLNDEALEAFRAPDGTVVLAVEVPPYRPMRVAKALAHMGFLLLEHHELELFDYIRRWLRGEVEHQPHITFVAVPGAGDAECRLTVYRRRHPLVGRCPLIVEFLFGNVGWYWHAPTISLRTVRDIELPTILCSEAPPHRPNGYTKFVRSDGQIRRQRVPMQLRVEEVEGGNDGALQAFLDGLPPLPDDIRR